MIKKLRQNNFFIDNLSINNEINTGYTTSRLATPSGQATKRYALFDERQFTFYLKINCPGEIPALMEALRVPSVL